MYYYRSVSLRLAAIRGADPWSAADAPVGPALAAALLLCGDATGDAPLGPLLGAPLFQKRADVGVGRGPGGPPRGAYLRWCVNARL